MNVTEGQLVVVNDDVSTTVYVIAEVRDTWMVHLRYASGDQMVSGGWVDKALCQKPTKEQLEYNLAYMYRWLQAITDATREAE